MLAARQFCLREYSAHSMRLVAAINLAVAGLSVVVIVYKLGKSTSCGGAEKRWRLKSTFHAYIMAGQGWRALQIGWWRSGRCTKASSKRAMDRF